MYKPHIKQAHQFWSALVKPGDIVIDATCGNGQDSLLLAKLALQGNGSEKGRLFACDLQNSAIKCTYCLLNEHLNPYELEKVSWHLGCHAQVFSKLDLNTGSVTLIVYNLGYLPGGDKTIITHPETTIKSLNEALPFVQDGGAISITCYTGHEGGQNEENAVLQFAKELNPREWLCCHYRWLNRVQAPSLLLIQKGVHG